MHVLSGEPRKVSSQPAPSSLRSASFQRHALSFHVSEKEKCFPEDNGEGNPSWRDLRLKKKNTGGVVRRKRERGEKGGKKQLK